MNSFISHRLYVEAVGNETAQPKTARNVSAAQRPAGIASVIPLELIVASKPVPEAAAPPLRAPAHRPGS